MKKIFALSSIFCLTSCWILIEPLPKGWDFDKRVLSGVRGFPTTDTDYGKGFKDGCYAAWEMGTKGYLSDVPKATFDVKRSHKSPDYKAGWWDGTEQCFYILDHEAT